MKRVLIVLIAMATFSCMKEEKYVPYYELAWNSEVPDSLKAKHREYITELVRASNQHLSAGDYEDIDETIEQAEETANRLFTVSFRVLRRAKDFNSAGTLLRVEEMTQNEKEIFDSLLYVQ